MGVLSNIEPKEVFKHFEALSMVPRRSYRNEKISAFCVDFAKEHGLEYVQDECGNVVIYKPGTPGYENSEPVILQGHMDMVAAKTVDSDHDFDKDPLDIYVDGDYVTARDTTLGADDGFALAYAMAILESDDIPHPPIEAVFTVDEEVGMMGAEAGRCHNRGAITSDVKLVGMNRSPTNGFIQETGTEDLKQGAVSLIVHMKGSRGQSGNEMSNSFLFYGGSLLALDFGFLHPLDYRGFQVV